MKRVAIEVIALFLVGLATWAVEERIFAGEREDSVSATQTFMHVVETYVHRIQDLEDDLDECRRANRCD